MSKWKPKPQQPPQRLTRAQKIAGAGRRPGDFLLELREQNARGTMYNWWTDESAFHWVMDGIELETGRKLPVRHNNRAPLPLGWQRRLLEVSDRTGQKIGALAFRTDEIGQYAQCSMAFASFQSMYEIMLAEARVFVARTAQLDAFHGVVPPPEPLRLPFTTMMVEFETPRDLLPIDPLGFGNPVQPVRAAFFNLQQEGDTQHLTRLLLCDDQFSISTHVAMNGLDFSGMVDLDPEAMIHSTNAMHPLVRTANEELYNYLYLLQARNVRLEVTPPDRAAQAMRRQRGQFPLPDLYRPVFTDLPPSSGKGGGQGQGSKQTVRYDVTGHWRTYRRGTPEVYSKWIHEHQRGLANDVYRPRTRAQQREYEQDE